MRASRAALLLLAAAAVVAAQDARSPAPSPAAACVLPFDVDAVPARAGGFVSGDGPAVPRGPLAVAGKLTVSGRLALALAGPCPSDAASLRAALPSARLLKDGSELRLAPESIKAKAGSRALALDVTVANASLALTSAAMPAAPLGDGADAKFAGLLVTATPSGAVTAGGKSVTLSGKPANGAATFDFTRSTDAMATLVMPKLNITFRPTYTMGGVEGNATFWFATNLTATSVLGCDPPCGDNGRCAQPPGAAASAACACRCGFTGAACDAVDPAAPSPCPAWPAWPALAVPAAAPAAAPKRRAGAAGALPTVPGGDDPVLGSLAGSPAPSLADAATLTGTTPSGETCTCAAAGAACPAGWAGANCDACTTDAVCAASTGDPAATCHTGTDYTRHSVTKAYVCDLSRSPLGALLDSKRGYWINCTTTPTTVDLGSGKNVTGGTCEVGLRLASDMANPVICTAVGCAFSAGSAKVACASSTCTCPQAKDGKTCPSLVAPYVSQISGKSVSADCTGRDCTLNVQDFPVPLKTPCVPGDCQSERAAELAGGPVGPAQARNFSSLIAAVPVLVLLATAALAGANLAAATAGGRPKKPTGGAPPAPGATATATLAGLGPKAPGRAPAHPVRELKWEGVTCTVPSTRYSPAAAGGTAHWGAAAAGVLGAAAAAVAPASRGLAHCQSTAAALLADRALGGGGGRGGGSSGPDGAGTPGGASSSSAGGSPAAAVSPPASSAGGDALAAAAPAAAASSAPRRWLPAPRPRVTILRGVSGEARGGELVGVLGPSGCGKTTMLSILAGSVSSLSAASRVRGLVTLDGAKRKAWATRLVAHVPQFDFLLPTLTVAETLRYSALLRLPPTTPAADVHDRVQATLEELGLAHVAASQVGGASGVRGVSGGERRRVTIGMELVIDPSVVVLDEPTSGLDSHTALNLMETLKSVAAAGRIVLLSFHQPSPAMFALLDRVFLMARGHVLYQGAPAGAAAFFDAVGAPVPPGTALAEHMLTAVSDPSVRDPLLARVLAGREAEEGGGKGDVESGKYDAAASPALPPPPSALRRSARPALTKPARTPFLRELAVLFWRAGTEVVRNPALLLMHCAMGAVMGVLCGGIFFGLGFDIAGAQGRLGACFFSLTLMALTSLTTVDLLTNERGLVVKEVLGGYYRPASYYLSKAVLDGLLLRVLPAILFAVPLYPMSGFQGGAPHVALFFCVLAVFSATVGALSMAVTVGFGTAGRAALVMNLVLLLSLLFAGFLVNVASITPALAWVHWLSVFFYGFEALTTNELSGVQLTFTAPSGGGGVSLGGLGGGGGGKGAAGGGGISVDIKGDTFLAAIGIDASHLLRDVAVLDAYFFAFVAAGVGLLYYTMPRALVVRPPKKGKA